MCLFSSCIVCNAHYCECFIKILGMRDNSGNPANEFNTFNKDEIIASHKSSIASLKFPAGEKSVDLFVLESKTS